MFLGYALIAKGMWKGDIFACRRWGAGKFGRVRTPYSKAQHAEKGWPFFIPNRRWNSKIVWKRPCSPRIHSEGEATCMEWRSQTKPSGKFGEDSTDRRNKRWRRSPQWFLVIWRWFHLSSSRRFSSSTLHSERRNMPNPTETCWRDQDHAHKFGRVARKPYGRFLECRCGSKFVRLMDRIHEVHTIVRKNLQQDMCGPRGGLHKSTQPTDLIICGLKSGPAWHKQLRKRKSINGLSKNQSSTMHLFDPGIILHLSLTVPKQMVFLKGRNAESREEFMHCCCNLSWMKSDRLVPWNVTVICEMFKTSYEMGKTPCAREPFIGPVIPFGAMVE